MGLHIFREQLSGRPEVYTKTVQGLLKLIDSERRGDQVGQIAHALSVALAPSLHPATSGHPVSPALRTQPPGPFETMPSHTPTANSHCRSALVLSLRQVERSLLQSLLRMFYDLGLYADHF